MNITPPRLKVRAFFMLLLLLVATSSTGAASVGASFGQTPSRITAMKAFTADPFEGSISLSDDIFARQQGNKPPFAGSGAANYPTHYLIVMVEVTGSYGHRVELTATEGRKIVWRKISETNVESGESFSEPIKSYAIFFIEGTRCELIRLRARLVGAGKRSGMTKAIEFGCGE